MNDETMNGNDLCLPWHVKLWAQLETAAATGRLGHALLLAGSAGLGKAIFARRAAKAMLCRHEKKTEPASMQTCGECSSCRQFISGVHPDYRWLSLETTEGTTKIPVDAVRHACAFLATTSAGSKTRILVVDRVDHLNDNGLNALLKTLEEPPAGAHLLLISETPSRLPATIRSRCQTLRFAHPGTTQTLDYLQHVYPEKSAQQRKQAAELCLDSPLQAAHALEDADLLSRFRDWMALLDKLDAGEMTSMQAAEQLAKADVPGFIAQLSARAWRRARAGIDDRKRLQTALRMDAQARQALSKLDQNANASLTLASVLIACTPHKSPR